jgi:hypothetical protein
MYNTTNYVLMDTIGKTLKANKQLVKIDPHYENSYNKNLLYDFTLLDKCNIDPELLTVVKNQCMKNTDMINRYAFIMTTNDIYKSFSHIGGNVFFKAHTVYSNSKNKRVCVIMQLVKIELYHNERKSLYNDFVIANKYDESIAYDYNIYDYEIA